jgi:hypothetical protein
MERFGLPLARFVSNNTNQEDLYRIGLGMFYYSMALLSLLMLPIHTEVLL